MRLELSTYKNARERERERKNQESQRAENGEERGKTPDEKQFISIKTTGSREIAFSLKDH